MSQVEGGWDIWKDPLAIKNVWTVPWTQLVLLALFFPVQRPHQERIWSGAPSADT